MNQRMVTTLSNFYSFEVQPYPRLHDLNAKDNRDYGHKSKQTKKFAIIAN